MSASPTTLSFETLPAASLTDALLTEAAVLFSTAYGIWGPLARGKTNSLCTPGRRVRMSPKRLRQQLLPPGARSVMVRCVSGDVLVGHVFATRWVCGNRGVCWVTQLCVRSGFRRRGVASTMLRHLRNECEDGEDEVFGILSSHPAALLAALRAFGNGVEDVDLSFARDHARSVMAASPVEYVSSARLKGELFGNEDGSVCCADTRFWVDHAEPLAALAEVKKKGIEWPFGELPEGCEWLVLVGREGGD